MNVSSDGNVNSLRNELSSSRVKMDDECGRLHGDVVVDPDEQLTQPERQLFHDLCHKYTDVITPQPGLYNGAMGHFTHGLNFADTRSSGFKY